jgi:hypothetical protein
LVPSEWLAQGKLAPSLFGPAKKSTPPIHRMRLIKPNVINFFAVLSLLSKGTLPLNSGTDSQQNKQFHSLNLATEGQ